MDQLEIADPDILFTRCNLRNDLTGKTVLDLGCGNGKVGPLLFQKYSICTYTGVDDSSDKIEKAQEKAKDNKDMRQHAKLICKNLHTFLDEAIENNSKYDLVCLFGVLEDYESPRLIIDMVKKISNHYCGSVAYTPIKDILSVVDRNAVFTCGNGHVFFYV